MELYWSFVLPPAAMLDGGRKLFEKGKAIREAQKARMVEKARQDENERIKRLMEQNGITLSPELVEIVFGNQSADSTKSTP